MNFMKAETTLERYGTKRKKRINFLESPRKKLNIEFSLLEHGPENQNCLLNCADMMCACNMKSQKQLLLDT